MLLEIIILFQFLLWPFKMTEAQDNVDTEGYELQKVPTVDANKLASIRFGNATSHLCTGVILGRRTIMTSAPCINSYIPIYSMLQDDFGSGKCIVVVNATKEEEEQEGTEKRLCKKFMMNNRTWWSYGKHVLYGHPINILVDLPLEKKFSQTMETSGPYLEGFDLCKVYGWVAPNKNGSQKMLMSTVAKLMEPDKCEEMYKDRIRQKLPYNQFCVVESKITDDGRIIVCDRKLLGVFSRRMPIIYGWQSGNVNLYTFASNYCSNPPWYMHNYAIWIWLNLLVMILYKFVLR